MVLLQDNAPIHTAKKTKRWLQSQKIDLLPIPPNSPDLNPIEHAWPLMESEFGERYLHLLHTGDSQEAYDEFKEAVKVCWGYVKDKHIKTIAESMPRRVRAVLDAGGWHTSY